MSLWYVQIGKLVKRVQRVAGEKVEVAFVGQGYIGEAVKEAAAEQGVELRVKHAEAKWGLVLPKRWTLERSSA